MWGSAAGRGLRRPRGTARLCSCEAGAASKLAKSERRAAKKKAAEKYRCHPMAEPPPPSAFPPNGGRDFFHFELLHQSKKSGARVGRIHTPHGVVDTPGFVGVATNGAFKALDHRLGDDAGLQLMFCNTYHMLLQPGPEVVEKAGGLHKFINRERPIITDSGGFQVFSMAEGSVHDELNMKKKSNAKGGVAPPTSVLKISEEGAAFRSYVDGRRVLLTPESSVRAQKALGADIIIPLDELPPYHISAQRLEESVARTHRWEARSLFEHLADVRQQAMYCVLHGGVDEAQRLKSVEYLTALPFDGFAIGGSLGKDRAELMQLLKFLMPLLPTGPAAKPNHLLGIADVESIEEAVPFGVDTFDSCFPLRIGRHGTLLTPRGRLYVKRGKYREDYGPIDPGCDCPVCRNHSLAYIHHLFRAKEPMAWTLCTLHNLHYMCDMMARIRQQIIAGEI